MLKTHIVDFDAGQRAECQCACNDFSRIIGVYMHFDQFGIRHKNKSLEGCLAVLLKAAFQNQMPVNDKIIKAAGIKGTGKATFGVPSMGEAKKLISDYYGGKK